MEKHTIITVGRQFGSGGKSVAAELGRRLGIALYDDELIVEAARSSGICTDIFNRSDEVKRGLGFGEFTRSGISGAELFQIQSDTIRAIAERESAVFVGRASDYVLRDMDCLDVFLTAPREVRVDRISRRRSISREEAARIVDKMDRTRKEYYDFFTFGDNWGRAENYDLCIDASILGVEGTAESIISFGRAAGLIP